MVSNSPVTLQRRLAVMAVFLAVCVAQALTQLPSLEPSKGHIALSLSCAGRDAVRVTIANDGNVATGVLIGMVAGPRSYFAINMMFEGLGGKLSYWPDNYSGRIGGNLVPWVIVLPKASDFSFVVRAAELVAPATQRVNAFPDDLRLKVLPDDLRVSLTGRALTDQGLVSGMPLTERWTGSATSNTLQAASCGHV